MIKKLLTLLLIIPFFINVFSQNNLSPLTNNQYNILINKISSVSNEDTKLKIIENDLSAKTITSKQMEGIAIFFISDYQRYLFCANAYQKLTDPENVYSVFDGFNNLSGALRFYNYISNYSDDNQTQVTAIPEPEPVEADFEYPNPNFYSGECGCEPLVSDRSFDGYFYKVSQIKGDDGKMDLILNLVDEHCFSVTQIMKLVNLIQFEENRFSVLSTIYPIVFDKDNYLYVKQLLTNMNYINGINEIYSPPLKPKPQPIEPICEVTDYELGLIITQIENESFETDKLRLAKNLVEKNECFTSMQIVELIKLIGFEADKLDFAKFAWHYTIDKNNYSFVSQELGYSTDREALQVYIDAQE